ncbi:efflux RND transporter periplasmic adaptor subunit [Leptospira meyeri]|uniref:efflux RND transporter periplasmic adaptor subunit n=1 Tax=Leptospira meyeri TaxID=29508 RepID=UPI0002BD70D7|nr:efflux RND transporter periplasmic adaptor subunit [Leptospira meyeri]EMJ90290.1 HlyD family secretion protein [Leptospira meyeri serovar Semaranga str. Veldrot Semarang 173]
MNFDKLKKIYVNLSKIPFFSKIVISGLTYLFIILAYTNLTWIELRSKIPFVTRIFYVKSLSIKDRISSFKSEEVDDLTEISVQVVIAKIEKQYLSPSMFFAAIVDPVEKVDLFSKVGGRLEKIYVKEGEAIKVGQKIAKLDSLSFEIDLLKLNANLESARASYSLGRTKYQNARRNIEIRFAEEEKRIQNVEKAELEFQRISIIHEKKESLYNSGVIAEEEYLATKQEYNLRKLAKETAKKELEIVQIGIRDQDITTEGIPLPSKRSEKIELWKDLNTRLEKAEMEVAEKNVNAAKANIESVEVLIREATLVSPINGIVYRINRNVGELINAGANAGNPIVNLVSTSELNVIFNANEVELGSIMPGQKAVITSDSFANRNYKGTVLFSSPVLDQRTHSAEIKIRLEKTKDLKPGMYVKAEILSGKKEDFYLIPEAAAVPYQEKFIEIFQFNEGRAFKKRIESVQKTNGFYMVREGISDDDYIIISPLNQLYEGVKVSPAFNK